MSQSTGPELNKNSKDNSEDNLNNPTSIVQQNSEEETSFGTYLLIGLIIVVLCLLGYYAYGKFIENSKCEPFVKELTQERDDTVVDFNLRDSIKQLESMQKNILSRISSDIGI
jgi:hypothetical protein